MTEQIQDAAAWRPRAMAGLPWRRWTVDLLLIAGGTVSLVFVPLSIAIHSIVGLMFAGMVGPHLWHRRRWIAGTLRRLRQRRRLPVRLRWSLGQSALLTVLVLVVTGSGLWDWLDARTRIRYHAISGVILAAVAARHGWTRRGWLTRRRSGVRPAGDPGRPGAATSAAVSRLALRPGDPPGRG